MVVLLPRQVVTSDPTVATSLSFNLTFLLLPPVIEPLPEPEIGEVAVYLFVLVLVGMAGYASQVSLVTSPILATLLPFTFILLVQETVPTILAPVFPLPPDTQS